MPTSRSKTLILSISLKLKFFAILCSDFAAIAKLPLFFIDANKAVGDEKVVKFF